MTECNICAEKYNKSTRKCIKCEYCDFQACLTCMKTYILDKPEPKCMNTACDREWTRRFIAENFPITFINKEFRPHLAEVQFELEKSRLPQSQITLELETQHKKLVQDERNILRQIDDLRNQYADIANEKTHLKARIDNRYRGVEDTGAIHTERAKFVRACPANDCRGYLSTAWRCGVCERYTCPECHEMKGAKDAEHVCDPLTLASAQAIAKDSKNCPNCSAMIFRIAGCNHMFCTACNTGFDWKTGKIIRGAVGNPHYYDYITQRNAGNMNPGLNPACGENDLMILIRSSSGVANGIRAACVDKENMVFGLDGANDGVMSNIYDTPLHLSNWLISLLRNVGHVEEVTLQSFSSQNEHRHMEELRVNYLKRYINDEQFRLSLKKHTQKASMKRDIRGIIEMAVQATKDIAARILAVYSGPCNNLRVYAHLDKSLRKPSARKTYLNELADAHRTILPICLEMEGLCKYVNTELEQVVVTYHSSAKPLNMDVRCNIAPKTP